MPRAVESAIAWDLALISIRRASQSRSLTRTTVAMRSDTQRRGHTGLSIIVDDAARRHSCRFIPGMGFPRIGLVLALVPSTAERRAHETQDASSRSVAWACGSSHLEQRLVHGRVQLHVRLARALALLMAIHGLVWRSARPHGGDVHLAQQDPYVSVTTAVPGSRAALQFRTSGCR